MTTALSLRERAPLIEAAFRLGTVVDRAKGLVKSVRVPGHETHNRVFMWTRREGDTLVKLVECQRETPLGHIPCPAYDHGHVCYHALGAVRVAAEESGFVIMGWFAARPSRSIMNLRQFRGCRVGKVIPKGGGDEVWFLWR